MGEVIVFQRSNGVIGVGYIIEHSGIEKYSIAWPDQPSTRHPLHRLEADGVEILHDAYVRAGLIEAVELDEALPEVIEATIEETNFEESATVTELIVEPEELPEVEAESEWEFDPKPEAEPESEAEEKSEAEQIREFLRQSPQPSNKQIITEFASKGVKITSSQISKIRREFSAASE